MFYMRLKIVLILVTIFFGLDTHAMESEQKKFSLFSFLTHPGTILSSSLASLGLYCACNQEQSFESYSWLKQQFDAIPSLVTCVGALLLGVGGYYVCWSRNEAAKQKNKIKKMRKWVFDLEEARNKNAVNIVQGDNVDVREIVTGLANRIGNLESIVIGTELNEKSFGIGVPLVRSKIELIFEKLGCVEGTVMDLQNRVSEQQVEMQGGIQRQNTEIVGIKQSVGEIKRIILANKKKTTLPVPKRPVPVLPRNEEEQG